MKAHAYEPRDFRVGATLRAGRPVPDWKQAADFLLVQVSYDLDQLVAWRETVSYAGKMLAGVMVMASAKMAQTIADTVPEIGVPEALIRQLGTDRDAGVDVAVEMIDRIRSSGCFDGVHLVPVGRYNDIATRLRHR